MILQKNGVTLINQKTIIGGWAISLLERLEIR